MASNVSVSISPALSSGIRAQTKKTFKNSKCNNEDSAPKIDGFVKDINDFTSSLEMFRGFGEGKLSDSFRQSALAALRITVDYPETFADFDFSVGIPRFYQESASKADLQTLKTKLRKAAQNRQKYHRAKEIVRLAAMEPSTEDMKSMTKSALMEAFRKQLKKTTWKTTLPAPYYIVYKFFPSALNNTETDLLSGFTEMNHIYQGGNHSGKITSEYKLAVLEILKVTVDKPIYLDDEVLKPAVPPFIQKSAEEYEVLMKKLVNTIRHQQNLLRVKEVLDWAIPMIADAKKAGEVITRPNLIKLFEQGIELFRKPKCTIPLSLLIRCYSEEAVDAYIKENTVNTGILDSTRDAVRVGTGLKSVTKRSHTIPSVSSDAELTHTESELTESDAQSVKPVTSKKGTFDESPVTKTKRRSGRSHPSWEKNRRNSTSSSSRLARNARNLRNGPSTWNTDDRAASSEDRASTSVAKTTGSTSIPEAEGLAREVLEQLNVTTEEERTKMFEEIRREVDKRLTKKLFEMTKGLGAVEQGELIRKVVLEKSYQK